MTPKEAFKDITRELRQRHMDMYADCDKESVDVTINEMEKRENIVNQALTDYEQLQRDVKRYIKLEKSMGMMNTWLGTLDEMKEFSILKDKLSKVGNSNDRH